MLDPGTLAQLSPEQRLDLLEQLAAAHYGTKRFRTEIARDFDIARSSVGDWNKRPRLIPNGVLLCLSAWVHHARFRQETAAQIDTLAEQMAQLSAKL